MTILLSEITVGISSKKYISAGLKYNNQQQLEIIPVVLNLCLILLKGTHHRYIIMDPTYMLDAHLWSHCVEKPNLYFILISIWIQGDNGDAPCCTQDSTPLASLPCPQQYHPCCTQGLIKINTNNDFYTMMPYIEIGP